MVVWWLRFKSTFSPPYNCIRLSLIATLDHHWYFLKSTLARYPSDLTFTRFEDHSSGRMVYHDCMEILESDVVDSDLTEAVEVPTILVWSPQLDETAVEKSFGTLRGNSRKISILSTTPIWIDHFTSILWLYRNIGTEDLVTIDLSTGGKRR